MDFKAAALQVGLMAGARVVTGLSRSRHRKALDQESREMLEIRPLSVSPHSKRACTGITWVDSVPLAVCPNRRIGRHQVFEG